MVLSGSWGNLCDVGGIQKRHYHANCLLSGTVYLNTDRNSKIRFTRPRTYFSNTSELHDQPEFSQNAYGLDYHFQDIELSVSNGDCLFWP
jgi:hypothetical protein